MRWRFNWHPAYRHSGGRIVYIDETLREVRLRLPLNRGTRNLNGTIYGGSIYAAVDPIHAVMLVSVARADGLRLLDQGGDDPFPAAGAHGPDGDLPARR